MSNTCSATSTRATEPRRRPWRLLLALLLLVVGAADVYFDVLPAYHRYRADSFSAYLPSAGVIAEEVESRLADTDNDDPKLDEPILLVLGQDEQLAAARVWSQDGVELCVTTRDNVPGAPAPTPDFDPLRARLKDAAWMDQAQHLQALAAAEGRVVDTLDIPTADNRNDALVQQDSALQLANTLTGNHPALTPALTAMNAAMDKLSDDTPRDWAQAQQSARDAQATMSDVLETYRAQGDDVLPAPALAALAPAPASWLARLFPEVHTRRVLVPLFAPAATADGTGTGIGFAEALFYDRPVDFVIDLGWHAYPLPACLLALLAVVIIRRRRRVIEDMPEVAEIADEMEF